MLSRNQIERFVNAYVTKFESLSASVERNYRILLFPSYLASPHKIRCTISSTFGVAIEFYETADKWKVEVNFDSRRIEDAVLPSLSQGGAPFFQNRGSNNTIGSLNLITRDFFERHKEVLEALSRAANLVKDQPNKFFEIEQGDLRLVDLGLGYNDGAKDVARRIPCLWLFASNSSNEFSPTLAEQFASQHYGAIIQGASKAASIQMLGGTLEAYQKLLEKAHLTEEEMQKFLSNNMMLLQPSFRFVWDKGDLKRLKMPEADFLVKTSDNKFVLVELESPGDNLLTHEQPPTASKELRKAEAQMTEYLSEVRNRILNFRDTFDRDISVENLVGEVVIGRSSTLTDDQKKALQKHAASFNFSIITYDELFERAKALLENFGLRYGAFGK
jgi:hypothetical protein